MKLKRILSVVLAVALMISTVATVSAGSSEFGAMEFIVTSDKTSVAAGDTVTITITGNGRMNNLSTIQYQIVFDPSEFSTGNNAKKAFDANYYALVSNGGGVGAITTPKFAQKDGVGGTTKIGTVTVMDSSLSGETEEGDPYMLFITDGCDLYGKTTAILGKIVFTALAAVDDISDCFTIQNAKTAYGDETGSLESNIIGTAIQLADTIAAQSVIAKIDAIGSPVTYSSKAKILEARAAYDAITIVSLKVLVTNFAALTAAESAMGAIEQKMANVKALIAAIGTVTLNSESAIADARAAFAALADDEKAALANEEETLKAAEDDLAALKQAEEDKAAAQPVVAQIEALFPVKLGSGSAIDAADAAYKALTPEQRAYVTNYAKIEEARSELAQLEKEAQEAADKAAAQPVVAQIEALFPVTLDSDDAIDAAEAAYQALTPEQRAYVTNYPRISEARQNLATLKAQKKAAEEVSELIGLIPENISNTNATAAREAIDTAKASYDALDAKDLVPEADVDKLNAALETIAQVEQAIEDAKAMDDAIEALFPVKLSSGNAIAAAEADFDKLTALAASYVTKKADLEKARADYEALVEEENEVQRIDALIAALGAVEGIDYGTYADVLADAKAVEEDLKALDTTLFDQSRVTNRALLNEIIERCLELQESMEKIKTVMDKIDSLGEITLASSTAIDIARGLYDDLTEDEQAMVENYSDLEKAEAKLEELIAAAEQEALDRAKAAAVEELIAKIGDVEYTPDCWKLISDAKKAFDALTDSQKGYVDNAGELEAAENAYLGLKADAEAIDAVIKAIDNIGKVDYSDESLGKIEKAQELYDALDDDLKPEVTNAYMIEIAKQNYQNAKKDYEDVQAVIAKIDNLGEIEYNDEVLQKLTDAQDAYDALRDDLKELVTNYKDLVEAWELYESLKPIIIQKNDVDGYKEKHVTFVTNIPDGYLVSFGSYVGQIIEIGGVVYHSFVTDEILSPRDIVLTAGTTQEQHLGSVINNDGSFTANDALLVNKFVAGDAQSTEKFANDSLAYIRADVNGSGTITAMDALMIAKKAAGVPINFKLFVVGMNANN